METKKPKKQQPRSEATKRKILAAAEEVFVRAGYESADIASIAALAERSTGALYAHYKSKEEIFLSLFKASFERKREIFRQHLEKAAGEPEARRGAMWREILLEISRDKRWSMLLLEFKLYALRHPEKLENIWPELAGMLRLDKGEVVLQMHKETGSRKSIPEYLFAVRMMQPLLSAIALESQIFPEDFDALSVDTYLTGIFDAMLV